MPPYRADQELSLHHGYYCEECLADRLNLSEDETRRSLDQRTFAEVTMAYVNASRLSLQ